MEFVLKTPTNQPIIVRSDDEEDTSTGSTESKGSYVRSARLKNPKVRRCLFPITRTRARTGTEEGIPTKAQRSA